MFGKLLKGRPIARELLEQIAVQAQTLRKNGVTPHLGVILVGDDKPSARYVKKKKIAARDAGIEFTLSKLPQKSSSEEVIETVQQMQSTLQLTGLIIQLPLPDHIDTQTVLDAIDPSIDVDCLTTENIQKLESNTGFIAPPTPEAVFTLIHEAGISDVAGKAVTIIGRGPLVGKPLATMMKHRGAIVSVCHSGTSDTDEQCRAGDIVVSGVGKKDLIRGGMIKPGAVVIDTGVSFEDKKMYGDVNVKEARKHASFVTPTPNGVGPLTVAHLLNNTVICAKRIYTNQANQKGPTPTH